MENLYKYAPLAVGDVRVLEIQPAMNNSPIHCSLRHISLHNRENEFIAVSWTWGLAPDPSQCPSICLNKYRFVVRPTLYTALDVFRKDKPISLWVDAICIDQNNPDEQAEQIPLMNRIYTYAQEIYVWLGGAENDSDLVMDTLRNGHEVRLTDMRFGRAFFQLLRRSWWARLWIVQEFVLNKKPPTMFCGYGDGISVDLVFQLYNRYLSGAFVQNVRLAQFVGELGFNEKTFTSLSRLFTLRQSLHKSGEGSLPHDLRNALSWSREYQATKPQDTVYGILGLVSTSTREQFVDMFGVDISRSFREVCHNATEYLLRVEKSSTFYADFSFDKNGDANWPSWVPNFSASFYSGKTVPFGLVDVRGPYLRTPREDVQISSGGLHLSVRGVLVGQLDKTLRFENEPTSVLSFLDVIENWTRTLRFIQTTRRYISMLDQFEIGMNAEPLWKTFVAATLNLIDIPDLRDEETCQKQFDDLMAMTSADLEGLSMAVLQKINEKPNILHWMTHTLVHGRIFFMTDKNSYGICESGAQDGDYLALLFPDHYVPFILRKRNSCFAMVGTAHYPFRTSEITKIVMEKKDRVLQQFDIV